MSKVKGERPRSVRVLAGFADIIKEAEQRAEEQLDMIKDFTDTRFYSEKAWVVMLIEQEIISRKDGSALLRAILDLDQQGGARDPGRPVFTPSSSFSIWSLEKVLSDRIGEDLAGNINIGKTLPEPHARLKVRDKIVDTLERALSFIDGILEMAAANSETVMPGYTHMSQAQPTTFGHYLLSAVDPLLRAVAELEAAYGNTNQSTLGCGALAGSSWPLNRARVAELLGFDEVLENSNDCVAAGDFCISTIAALTNIMTVVSRLTLDLQVWGMEEIGMVGVPEAYSDTSSMMPQKKNYGGQLERTRMDTAKVISCFQEAAVLPKNEPHGDMLAVLRMRYPVLEALCIVEKDLTILRGFLTTLIPQKQRMYALVVRGFSCASELANIIVREKQIPYRRAHHIVGTLVRLTAERNIRADQADSALLDEAAQLVTGQVLGLSKAALKRGLDPEQFIAAYTTVGGVAPREVQRMCVDRRGRLEQALTRQKARQVELKQAKLRLQDSIQRLLSEAEQT